MRCTSTRETIRRRSSRSPLPPCVFPCRRSSNTRASSRRRRAHPRSLAREMRAPALQCGTSCGTSVHQLHAGLLRFRCDHVRHARLLLRLRHCRPALLGRDGVTSFPLGLESSLLFRAAIGPRDSLPPLHLAAALSSRHLRPGTAFADSLQWRSCLRLISLQWPPALLHRRVAVLHLCELAANI